MILTFQQYTPLAGDGQYIRYKVSGETDNSTLDPNTQQRNQAFVSITHISL